VSEPASNISAISSRALWTKGIAILSALIAANLACWMLAWLEFREHPLLIGTAVLAYTLGLRHAVDADHIAAIDNVTQIDGGGQAADRCGCSVGCSEPCSD